MPRRKTATVAADQPDQPALDSQQSPPPQGEASPRGRAFRTTLSLASKGVTLGVREGHDWVVAFPADPGKQVKDKLMSVGFEYSDRKKWKVFTHAPNRPAVAALVKELKATHGDEISVNEYPVKQLVIAFDGPPGEEITSRLHEADWHFRSDRTWNADFTDANQKFARDFVASLPTRSRSAEPGR